MFLSRNVSAAALTLISVLALATPAPAQFRQGRPPFAYPIGAAPAARIFAQANAATQANVALARNIGFQPLIQASSPFPVFQSPIMPPVPLGFSSLNTSPFVNPGYGGYPNFGGSPDYSSLMSSGGYPGSSDLMGSGSYGGAGYGGSSGYATNPYPYGDYMNGVAAMTTANGQYLLQVQQARLLREQTEQARIQTRRQAFDQSLAERERAATPDQLRTQSRQQTPTNLSAQDLRSGNALNTVLSDIQRRERESGARGPAVRLDPNLLAGINLQIPGSRDSLGLFKDGGKFTWPSALTDTLFRQERELLDRAGPELVRQAAAGKLDPQLFQTAQQAADGLRDRIKASVDKLSPSEYVLATRYANELGDSLRSLNQPEVRQQLNGQGRLQGETVADLVAQMTKNGQVFGAVSSGDEATYQALLQALQNYNEGLARLARR